MNCLKTFSAVVVLTTVLLIFYSNLHFEMTHSHRLEEGGVKNQATKPEIFIPRHADPHNMSVSDGFRQSIPLNGAYWNRLLHTALRRLDNEEEMFRHNSPWSHCRVTNQESLHTNVHDIPKYPSVFQEFLKGMNCRDPPVLFNQNHNCISGQAEGDNHTFLLFAIKSTPWNFEQRQAVRETWGREQVYAGGLRVRTVFFLGSSSTDYPDLSALLSFEAKQFGDVVHWDFHESLFNLTLKMHMSLQWTLTHCPNVSFVLSGDDDVFVNTPALLSYLQSLDPYKASRLYAGHVISTASPHRDPRIKYYIPQSFYDGPYPAYAGGGGFIISGALLQDLYSVSHIIPFYPIDDVYFGMCCKALDVSPEAHAGFQTFDIQERDRQNLCVHKSLILVHRRSPQQMKMLWNGILSPLLTC